MGKEVREISHFFVAPPRVFPLSFWRVSRTSLPKNLHPLVHIMDYLDPIFYASITDIHFT